MTRLLKSKHGGANRRCPLKRKPTLKSLLDRFNLDKVSINMPFLTADITFKAPDKDAAWDLYVEMLTRVVTQPLPPNSGDEKAALESVHTLFSTTREILRHHGRKATTFSKVAIPILNQVVRPFTTKWHARLKDGTSCSQEELDEFRTELDVLAKDLRNYAKLLAEIACVEDLTDLEQVENGQHD